MSNEATKYQVWRKALEEIAGNESGVNAERADGIATAALAFENSQPLRLHCCRCGWTGLKTELDENKNGVACPRCPDFRDAFNSLSIIETTEHRHD